MTLAELNEMIEAKQEEIDNFEPDESLFEDMYNRALDEQGAIYIGDIGFSPSVILENLDPTAYQRGLSDYVDTIDYRDMPEYLDLQDELAGLEDDLKDIK